MQVTATELVYARSIHGGFPVRVVRPGAPPVPGRAPATPGRFELLTLAGDVSATYDSARALLTALTGNPNHGLTFDRYFGAAPTPGTLGAVFELFPADTEALTVAPTIRSRTAQGPSLGIDLERRGHEVRKLFFAGFGARVARSGFDPEDVLQEIYRGILARNRGKCPFDARKSSFGHYVHMVCECILNNYHRKETRRREFEQLGLPAPKSLRDEAEGAYGSVDAAVAADKVLAQIGRRHEDGDMGQVLSQFQRHLATRQADPLDAQVVVYLATGHGVREIAKALNVKMSVVTQVISSLRRHAVDWV